MEQSIKLQEMNMHLYPEMYKFVESHPIITIAIVIVLIIIVISTIRLNFPIN